jgi:YVTN family beta-propeller protein
MARQSNKIEEQWLRLSRRAHLFARGLAALAITLLLSGCGAGLPTLRPRQPDEGMVYLYLDPLPPGAERLRVSLGAVGAILQDGTEIPLAASLAEISGGVTRRQRLLAAGPLPAGEYSGIVLRARSAALRGESGESVLLVPDAPTRLDFRFIVRRQEGLVIALALKYEDAVDAAFRFSPAFSLYFPDRPAAGLMGFVANSRSSDITMFEKKSLQVFDVIATGRGPSSLALDQRARRLYVSLAGEDAVEFIDLDAGKIADRIKLIPGDQPAALALHPDGKVLLCANRGSNTLSFIDTGSRAELARIPVGNGPRFIAIDRAGRRAFVFNTLSNSLSVVDIVGQAVVRTLSTDPSPVRGDFNRRGDRLYVIFETTPYVTVINPDTGVIIKRFPVRASMDAIKVDPNTDFLYLGGRRELSVGVYEPFGLVAVDFLDTVTGIGYMATDGDLNMLYLVAPTVNRLLVSPRVRRRISGELDAGDGPVWVSLMGEN